MIKNFLKIAFRNLAKQKAYSLINVIGLAIGMTCCILILLYVNDELNYDRHHENADQIYRVAGDINFGGNHFQLAVVPAPMAEALVNDYPEVLNAVRFRGQGSFLVKRHEQNYKEEKVIFADNSLFDVFTVPLLSGDKSKALAAPNTVVLSKSTAAKYFEEEDPLGQTLIFDNASAYQVTGIFEDIPANSHFHFDFIASLETLDESRNNMWVSNNFNTYLVLQPGSDPAALEAKFDSMIEKYMAPQVFELLGASLEEMAASGQKVRYYLQPLKDIHLHSDLTAEIEPNGDIKYVYIFSAIAIFILLIACINFMNLSTARSTSRAREVGVRKVMGSNKKQLISQFLSESIFLSLLALAIALLLVELALPQFNALAEKQLQTAYIGNWQFMGFLTLIALFVGLVAGSYPAFVLSSFKPVNVLRSKSKSESGWGSFRNILVVFQFAASVILLVGTFAVRKQMQFIQNKELGFKKEQVLIIHDAYAIGSQLEAFKNEVTRHPSISGGTVSSYLPVSSSRSDTGFWPEGSRSESESVSMQIWGVDYDYVETMGMQIAEGRAFSKDFGSDSSAIILNKKAVENFGFEDPIGKRIYTFFFTPGRGMDPNKTIPYTIVGVLEDFHFESLKQNIGALGLRLGRSRGFISFRFEVGDVASMVSFVQDKWQQFGPGQPFDYTFLDDRFALMYKAERKVGDIFGVFAGLAVFTACLGLFGLASFSAQQRTQEIGIRKVLGASVPGVTMMFTRDFVRYVLIAGLIATPVAWYAVQKWLENFAYKSEIGLDIFFISIGIALAIAVVTVSFQAVKAALANPVDSLRYE